MAASLYEKYDELKNTFIALPIYYKTLDLIEDIKDINLYKYVLKKMVIKYPKVVFYKLGKLYEELGFYRKAIAYYLYSLDNCNKLDRIIRLLKDENKRSDITKIIEKLINSESDEEFKKNVIEYSIRACLKMPIPEKLKEKIGKYIDDFKVFYYYKSLDSFGEISSDPHILDNIFKKYRKYKMEEIASKIFYRIMKEYRKF